ncbi:O-antigen ligase family protein [Mesorhizobium sp. M3A.F.Ca.ET.174.01.1.1]|uniref:O-antigen ligase family protein n=1 Tax=unclassified Mesorhizobium TaxID=325217 RepID=UPI000FEA4136|nr:MULTISPECIES: O-antigen ligase family protein [unclassified Mesorhizobium]RWF26362.1 MAG: O-antigen ligase family protein [Mesorhizobium sp.]TGS85116.1 O-antigen ligase family protein [Mesorhizobium sp. M3A.F.Ca.ET.175.01.1.1]TGT23104.1 O-antigen ligase family protein [Mesorhizobium sp. M3A.F.Ca.ET.174.01.1.1]TIU14163.1 MAG: O-antigen ligase family protein [Mesorhizobium sp.]
MSARRSDWEKYLLGSVLFTALLIGGGTASGLYTDTVIEISAFIAVALAFSRPTNQAIPGSVLYLLFLILALFSLQIVPLPASLIAGLRPEALLGCPWLIDETRFISIGVGRTIECLLYVAASAAFFLAVMRSRAEQVYGLLPFFFMGVMCNGLAGAIQYSVSDNISIEGLLPFTINAGLFANPNHFAALLFVSIPFVIYHGLFRGHLLSSAIGLVALLLLLLAAGSRAGVLIGLAITVISICFLSARSRTSGFGVFALFVGLSVYTIGAWTTINAKQIDPTFGRAEFARTTIDGIKENWVTGVGFGNFQRAYQMYEKEEMIFSAYVNHAHNEYLEIAFEGGVIAAVLIALYLSLLLFAFAGIRRDSFQKAAFLSTAFLLVHSLVDYPLRTAALAMTFAYMNAIIFHRGFAEGRNQRPELVEVDHNGDKLFVPVGASP